MVDGRPVKAVAQVSKQAFPYVFDRVTGKPVWPIEERPVPQSKVPGETLVADAALPRPSRRPTTCRASRRRPDRLHARASRRGAGDPRPSPLGADLSCRRWLTDNAPDGKVGAVQSPGAIGGTNWNGAAVDPETGILYVPSITSRRWRRSSPPEGARRRRLHDRRPRHDPRSAGAADHEAAVGGSPRSTSKRGEIQWMAANGDGPRDHPALRVSTCRRSASAAARRRW